MADHTGRVIASTQRAPFQDAMWMERQERGGLEVKMWVRRGLGPGLSSYPGVINNPSFSHSIIHRAASSYTV